MKAIIYDNVWINDTVEQLIREWRQLERLQELLNTVCTASVPEYAVDITLILRKVERLQHSLTQTRKILEQFRDKMEFENRRAGVAYEDVGAYARRIFA